MAGRKKTETVEAEVVETAVVPAGKMEFRLINPTEDGFLRRIQWNKEELEAAVRAKIAGYENVVYTEENIKAAKNDRAELNKLIKAIEERRKQVKNIINEPYAVFEAELKEITALINEPVALIDQQVKAFEEKQKKEKKAAIKATYDETWQRRFESFCWSMGYGRTLIFTSTERSTRVTIRRTENIITTTGSI